MSTRGALYGLMAAALFGVSAPIAKLLLAETRPLLLASLLYLGGGAGVTAWRIGTGVLSRRSRDHSSPAEAPVRAADVPWLAAIVALGGVMGPVLMLWGLARLSGLATSLLLTLEGPFTVILALVLFREHLGRRSAISAALIFAGGALIAGREGQLGGDLLGAAAVAAACAAWALDNNLTQRLSLKNPFAVIQIKTLGAGTLTFIVALLSGEPLPPKGVLAAALGLGATAYGASVVLDAYALRLLGAAREAALFATAPFIGAVVAIWLLRDTPTLFHGGAALLMAVGVALLVRDRHLHVHSHVPLDHEHRHEHDEHHQHVHEGDVLSPHSHPHRHDAQTHEHPHVSDTHHRHRHRGDGD